MQTSRAKSPAVGDRAPDLDLVMPKDASGRPGRFRLEDAIQKGPLIVAFIPGAFTSTCHEQMCTMRDSWKAYSDLRAQMVVVSPDGPHVQKAWAKELGLGFPFGSDLNKQNIERWGVVWESWWGRVAKRATFVVDRHRIIRFAEVLEDADELPDFQGLQDCLSRV